MLRVALFVLSFLATVELSAAANRLTAPGPELIYQLAKFVQWPLERGADEPFVVGLIGFDPLFPELRASLEGRRLHGRPVAVRPVVTWEQMRHSHVLFVGVSERSNVRHILAGTRGANILTVSAIPGFGQMGGMVEMSCARIPQRPLALNPTAVRRSGLMLSPSLLAVVSLTRTEADTE